LNDHRELFRLKDQQKSLEEKNGHGTHFADQGYRFSSQKGQRK
jgi:hypothetical protein